MCKAIKWDNKHGIVYSGDMQGSFFIFGVYWTLLKEIWSNFEAVDLCLVGYNWFELLSLWGWQHWFEWMGTVDANAWLARRSVDVDLAHLGSLNDCRNWCNFNWLLNWFAVDSSDWTILVSRCWSRIACCLEFSHLSNLLIIILTPLLEVADELVTNRNLTFQLTYGNYVPLICSVELSCERIIDDLYIFQTFGVLLLPDCLLLWFLL